MILKQLIHYPDTNSVEATWVDVITPAIEVPESTAPDTLDEDGNVVPGEVIPAHTIPAVEVQVRCHSYADVQMDMLEADLGIDLPDHAALIATVRANIQPVEPEPPFIPVIVSMRQARLALLGAGLLTTVNDAIAVMPGIEGEAARIEWEYATEVRRDSPLVVGLASVLGLTEGQLDSLFIAANGV